MDDNTTTLLAVALVLVSALLYSQLPRKAVAAPLPPGPRGLPLLGNIADLPQSQPWVTFAEWGKTFGGIVHVRGLGRSIIVLNDAQYAIDMLEKNSRLYHDRGPNIPADYRWTEYRRLFAQFMGTRAKVETFQEVLQCETHRCLQRILDNPNSRVKYCRKYAGGSVLKLTYGYQAMDEDDPMVNLVNEAMDQFSETSASGAFLVDAFPILRYVPEWFPGASWKKLPKYKRTLQDMVHSPYEWTKQRIIAGTARSCFVSNHLDNKQVSPQEDYLLKWAAAGIYSGSADTSAAGIESFFLAMTLQIAAQQKAQAELDEVLGTDRLPALADRTSLPYVEALFAEILRTYTFGPLVMDHCTPCAVVITNVWQFFQDPKTYPRPEIFSPERFMATGTHSKETDPRRYLFGFGRRICPGMHLGDALMWLLCASALAAFDIRPPVKDGKPVFPSGKYMDTLISHPEPFECMIKPRSRAAEALILAAAI